MKNKITENVKKALAKKRPVKKIIHTAPEKLFYIVGLEKFEDYEVYTSYEELLDQDVVAVYELAGFQKIVKQTTTNAINIDEYGQSFIPEDKVA